MIERTAQDHWEIRSAGVDDFTEGYLIATYPGEAKAEAHAAFKALQQRSGTDRLTLIKKFAIVWIDD